MIKSMKSSVVVTLLAAVTLALAVPGCKPQSKPEPVIEKPSSAAREAGDAIKDAAHKTGTAIGHGAEKAWDGIKKGAHEVGHVATNVAGQVKTGAEKVGDKVQDIAK